MPAVPLTYEEVKRAVERKGGFPRIPLFWHKFYNQGTITKYGEALQQVSAEVVDDCVSLNYIAPGNYHAPEGCPEEYKWATEPEPEGWANAGITSRLVVSSTELADEFIAQVPDPSDDRYFEGAKAVAAATPGRYRVGWDFFCLFEGMWFRFGMADILADMAGAPERIERLCWAFTDYHKKVATKYAEIGAHAYFTSDDLGTQETLIFSPRVFRVDQDERPDDVAERARGLLAVSDTGVVGVLADHPKEVCIMGDDHPPLLPGEGEVLLVAEGPQAGLDSSRDVNAVAAQGASDIGIGGLIEMETDPLSLHGAS